MTSPGEGWRQIPLVSYYWVLHGSAGRLTKRVMYVNANMPVRASTLCGCTCFYYFKEGAKRVDHSVSMTARAWEGRGRVVSNGRAVIVFMGMSHTRYVSHAVSRSQQDTTILLRIQQR